MKRLIACFLMVVMLIQPVSVFAASTDADNPGFDQVLLSDVLDGEDTQLGEGEGGDDPTQQPGEGEGNDDPTQQPGEGEGNDDPTQQPGEGEGDDDPTQQPGEGEDDDEEEDTTPFSCYVMDEQGTKLNPYWSEDFEAWYIFVPSTMSIEQMKLYYTGSIAEASAGTVDKDAKVIEDGFEATGSELVLTMKNDEVHKIVVMQSKLPSVHITLNGATLDQVHKDKNVKYKKNTVSIMDPSGENNLLAENSVEFKGRGNSTWTFFHKKAYQIKFDDKTSVLGMGKAKKWVLLASAADETLMRNMLAFNLADQIGMDYVTEFEYVDLWINGEYRGNYMLGEKIEIGSSRVDLEDDNGTVFEQDQGFYYEEDYWLYNKMSGKYFTVKETNADTDDAASIQPIMDAFQASYDALMTYLYDTNPNDVTLEELGKFIDVDAIAKFYLINEYTCNKESTASSFYWYMDGLDDILHAGPVWDFDSCMGNEKNEEPYYMENHVLFNRLLTCPAFYERTVEIYNENKKAFVDMASNMDTLKAQIVDSATMNYIRWNVWGEANPKYTLNNYSASYEDGCDKLAKWLENRANEFAVRELDMVFANVSDDCSTMELYFATEEKYTAAKFAVWSDSSGQDDVKWYAAQLNEDGVWKANVDLSAHSSVGKYTVHVYGTLNGQQVRRAATHTYVDKFTETAVSAKLSADNLFIEATLSGVGMYQDLSVHVWCKTDGDEDLKKYAVSDRESFTKTCVINLRDHDEVGEYCVQFYGKSGDDWTLLGETTVDVPEKTWPDMDVKVSAAQKELTVTISDAKRFETLDVVVWGETDGKNDQATYHAVKNEDETWTVVVDLDDHAENGTYRIELWGATDGDKKVICEEKAEVKGIVFLAECISVYRLYNSNTQEHLLTANEEEMNSLLESGWQLDGLAWKAAKTGLPVYRLYNPYDDWHTYSTSEDEIKSLTELGWTVDGIVFTSAEAANVNPVYRLFNPYEQMNYHLLTASVEERDFLLGLGWLLDGVALNAVSE